MDVCAPTHLQPPNRPIAHTLAAPHTDTSTHTIPPSSHILHQYFDIALNELSQHFYEPWNNKVEMETASRRFQIFSACFMQICHNTSFWFAYAIIANTAGLLYEVYYITIDRGLTGPIVWKCFRAWNIFLWSQNLYDTSVALVRTTLKVNSTFSFSGPLPRT